MRPGIFSIGVVLLIIGALLYFIPNPGAGATTTTIGEGVATSSTSYGFLNVPIYITYVLMALGLIMMILGLALPEHEVVHHTGGHTYRKE